MSIFNEDRLLVQTAVTQLLFKRAILQDTDVFATNISNYPRFTGCRLRNQQLRKLPSSQIHKQRVRTSAYSYFLNTPSFLLRLRWTCADIPAL